MQRSPVSQILTLSSIVFCSAGLAANADDDVIAFKGGTILTASGQEHAPGVLVVSGGKIVDVGPANEVAIPNGAEVRDVSGKVIIPGLVDTHSHLGVYSRPAVMGNADGNESSHPVQSIVRALDSVNPFDPGIRMAVAGGITTANIMPGSANVIGGQTLYVKLRGHTPEQMWLGPEESLGGLKMANGENPKRSYGSRNQAPGTRMKVAALQRTEFIKAQAYNRKWDEHRRKQDAGEETSPPDRDLTLEPLVEVLEGRRTVHFHTHRADDILTVLRLKEEFGFDLVIQHGTEAYKVIDQIAKAGVPVSMTIVDSPGGKAEVVGFIEECGAELTRAGVKVLINTDDPVTESRLLLRTAATAHRGGMTEEETLRAITLHAAEALKLDRRLGSLERGKDADFVILSGRPFSVYTRVLETYIDGRREFSLDSERDRFYQTGGFAVDASRRPAFHSDLVASGSAFPARSIPTSTSIRERTPPRSQVRSEESEDVGTEFLVEAGVLYTVSGDPIENGIVHVKDGKIVFAGQRDAARLPADLPVLSVAAVTPGLIDAHSVVPLAGEYNIPADQDADETSDPNQSDVRALDGFHPSEPLLRFLLENGITVVHACPGRANVIAGQSGVFRTHGRSADDMVIRFPQAMVFNLGESPKGNYGEKIKTRMGTSALVRKALSESATYDGKRKKAEEEDKPFDRDLKKEQLALVLNGNLPAMFCAQRADDLLTAVRLAEEFQLKPVLALAAEGYLVAEQLQQAGVPVIVHPTMQRLGNLETYNSSFSNAAHLADAGIPIAIGSGYEGYVPKSRVVRHEAALGMVYGLGHPRALHAVTLGAAKILGIDDEFGSLDAGKTADLVLYDGDPFEHVTHVTAVIVDGRLVYRRGDRQPIPLAERMFHSVPEIPCCNWW